MIWRSPEVNALGPRVFELERPAARTLYVGEDNRPKSLKDQLEVELENATIFNCHTDLCVIDGSQGEILEQNTNTLRGFVSTYGARILLLTVNEWLTDLNMYRDSVLKTWQEKLDDNTLDEHIVNLLHEQALLDEAGKIDAEKLLTYLRKNVFFHISGLRNYTVLVAKGERVIMLFDDDAPRETFVLFKEDRARIRAARQSACDKLFESMFAEVGERLRACNHNRKRILYSFSQS